MPHAEVLSFIATLETRRPRGALYSLGSLFARLARAAAPREAAAIEDRIWDCWMSHDNAEAEADLDRATTDIAARRYDIAETRLARLVRREACAVVLWCGRPGRVRHGAPWNHDDAVHRAGGDTQLTAGAQRREHGVHLLARADDGIHRAGG